MVNGQGYSRPWGQVAKRGILLLCLLTLTLFASASDPPDSETNPLTGDIESVDAAWNGTNYDIRHTIDPGQGGPKAVAIITTHPDDDLAPRIAIKANGGSCVTWWRDSAVDGVYYRRRSAQDGTWTSEALVSEPTENSRYPEIADDDATIWIAYEFDYGTQTAIAVNNIRDDVEPFGPRTVIATTTFTGDLDVLVHAEQGHVWVTWVHSSTDVGWSEYDKTSEAWGPVLYVSYATDSVAEARERIRQTVLGN